MPVATIVDDDFTTVKPIHRSSRVEDPQPETRAVPSTSDLDVDWGNTDVTNSDTGLSRIVPADKKSIVRCAVLTDICMPKHAWTHFIVKGDGSKTAVRCLSTRDKNQKIIEPFDCCKRFHEVDEPQRAQHSFVVLALAYTNADPKTGKLRVSATGEPTPITFEIGFLKLSETAFAIVRELNKADEDGPGGDPHDIDIFFSHRQKGLGYDYVLATRKARFRANPTLLAEVQAEAAKYVDGEKLSRWLGRKVSPVEMRLILGGTAERKNAAEVDNTDDL